MKYFVLVMLLLALPVLAFFITPSPRTVRISSAEWDYCMSQPGNDAMFCRMFQVTKIAPKGTTYYKARQ
jgi:hypothetical protein